MPLDSETYRLQQNLALISLTGKFLPTPGVSEEQGSVYHNLVRNNFDDTLRRAYPIAHSYLKDLPGDESSQSRWEGLVNTFMQSGHLPSPELWKMPKSFFEFFVKGQFSEKLNLPFLDDLLYFEWIEIEVQMMQDATVKDLRTEGSLDGDALLLNMEHFLLSLSYPVFKVAPSEIDNKKPSNYFLFIYRHPEELNVHFIELSLLHTILIEELKKATLNGGELLQTIITTLRSDAPTIKIDTVALREQMHLFLGEMIKRKAILGFAI